MVLKGLIHIFGLDLTFLEVPGLSANSESPV